MHDPLVVAFEIRRPWPSRQSYGRYWPSLITVWHREPGGHDSGEICRHYIRYQDADGTWHTRMRNGWRFHVTHWRLQIHPLQDLRRQLLTRCAWCGGRQRKNDAVNISHQWDGPRGRWWQGEPGLYHHDCSMVANARRQCTCDVGPWDDYSDAYGPYGSCASCGKTRPFGVAEGVRERRRLLATVPQGSRDADVYRRVREMAKAEEK